MFLPEVHLGSCSWLVSFSFYVLRFVPVKNHLTNTGVLYLYRWFNWESFMSIQVLMSANCQSPETVHEKTDFYCRNPEHSILISSHWLAALLQKFNPDPCQSDVCHRCALACRMTLNSWEHWFLIGSDMLRAALFVFVVAPVEHRSISHKCFHSFQVTSQHFRAVGCSPHVCLTLTLNLEL